MPANTFSQLEAYGLFILLAAPSKFSTDLNNQIQADGATIDSVNTAFLNALSGDPFHLDGKVDVTKFQALWTNVFGNLALHLDQTPAKVLATVTPYTDPPCPKDADQRLIWAQLHK